MQRRTVGNIKTYLKPRQIYQLIVSKSWPYAPTESKEYYECRDRAFMSLAYLSAGRVKAVCLLERDNLLAQPNYIVVQGMRVVKRTQRIIDKYGESVTVRDDFALPLKPRLFENPYWDQLIPFTQLVLEYLQRFDPKHRLFLFGRKRGWQIINYVTGMFPNWFRAQAEHFYGNFLIKDTVKLAKFVKVVNPMQVAHYIGYDWTEQLKQK